MVTDYGKTSHPAWFHNLQANPSTTIEIGPDTVSVKARFTDTEERDRIFEEQVRAMPPFADYVESSGRVIPVVVLERI